MKKLLLIIVLLGVAGTGGYTYLQKSANAPSEFRTAEVKRWDMLVTIGATGTVEPEEVIDVGAQVAGKIKAFGKDPRDNGKVIDYGTPVEEGTILAHIDESLYAADVEQNRAQVEFAKANVARAQADQEQLKAKLIQAERNWERAKELGPSRALSASDFDSYEATYLTAKASLAVGEASIVQAQKAVAQAEATLRRSLTNLGYCTIKSPVKGVIIDRRVNIGQTVVASLSAPSLFLIAKDLKKMQIWAAVNEADIGSIHAGQPVTFLVDAYPGEGFRGEVGKVRLNASMTQNVVTYTVEINTDNSSGRLLPYLTANVQFEVSRRKDVMLVPNAALRFLPASQQVAPDARQSMTAGPGQGRGSERPGRSGDKAATKPASTGTKPGILWVQDGEFLRPLNVAVGASDGTQSEVMGENVTEGLEVVTGEAPKGVEQTTKNPFTPQFFGGRRG